MLIRRYGTRDEYMRQFAAAFDATITAGFLLENDRASLRENREGSKHARLSAEAADPEVGDASQDTTRSSPK